MEFKDSGSRRLQHIYVSNLEDVFHKRTIETAKEFERKYATTNIYGPNSKHTIYEH